MTTVKPWLVPAYIACCLVLGGASNEGLAVNLALQITALLMLVSAFWVPMEAPPSAPKRALLWLISAIVAVAGLQFLPLSELLWSTSPGRRQLWDAALLTGQKPYPLQLTLSANQTQAALVWALPAFAVCVTMLRFKSWHAAQLAWVVVGMTSLNVLVGAAQLAGGPTSPAYLYLVTNRDTAVGFFANANHFATLLLVSIPFAAALARHLEMSRRAPVLASRIAVGTLAVVIITGIAINGSRAGLALAGPVFAASLLCFRSFPLLRRLAPVIAALVLIGAVGIILSSYDIGLKPPAATLETAGQRDVMWATTGKAIADFWPLGSGLGTFERVYVLYDNPALTQNRYVNHAHNDYLEIILETGVLGVSLIGAFFLWWIRRAAQVLAYARSAPFAWAGAVASCAILVHSIVDYPLRTAAIGALFGACCVLMCLRRRSASANTRSVA